MQFLETRNYGFNQIIKQYARFPWYLPLPAHLEHGWSPDIMRTDLPTQKPLMLVFQKRHVNDWKKESQIPVAVMGSPFSHFKNMHHLAKRKDAKGTVVFPGHSTYGQKSLFSTKKYCEELKNLPEEFQPITICLFWLDFIEKEKTDIYRKYGFKIVTAGYKFSIGLNFVKNFYKILASHKYASSNEAGSHLFYAVDFGLPFFLTGKAPFIENYDKRPDAVKPIQIGDFKYGSVAMRLFDTGPVTKISRKQKEFVDGELGINDCLSREELNALLNRYNKSYRSFTKTVQYLLETVILTLVLNGPWGRFVVRTRKKFAKK